MASHAPSPAGHDGLSRPDLEFGRFEYLRSPRVSAHSRSSDNEAGLPGSDGMPVHTKKSPTDTKAKRPGFDWNGSWAWEIGSVTLSVVGVALLVAFLVTINNTPYANGQYTAAPNTVVSIIVTITKAALLVSVSSCLGQLKWNLFHNPAPLYQMQVIDQASRGPWGSMEVLLRGIFGSNAGSLTYIGASLTILALAVDPFAQQILTFPSRTVPALNATAFAQTSKSWTSTVSDAVLVNELPPKLLTAVLSGLMQTHSPLEPQCDARSCEFPEFVSLGMCSKCEDVTAQTSQRCRRVPENSPFRDPTGTDFHPAFNQIPLDCNYLSPSNFSFHFGAPQMTQLGDFHRPELSKYDNIWLPMQYWSSRPMASNPIFDIEDPIVSLIEIDYTNPVPYTVTNATAPPLKPLVSECAVYFCERRYAAMSHRPGDQKQSSNPGHVIETQQLIGPDAETQNRTRFDGGPFQLNPPHGSAALSKDPRYFIDKVSFARFNTTLANLFNSTVVIGGNVTTSDALKLATILRRGNLGQLLDSMSTSVTDAIRTNVDGYKVSGEGIRDETFIHVRWPWIILPVVVTVGSIALLLGTAIGSKQKKAELWKCMVLPLITIHFDTTPENTIASVRSVDGMTDMSKKMRAVVVQDEGPIAFKEK